SYSMNSGELYDYVNSAVAPRISMLQGVAQVQLYGAKRAVRIKVNPEKLASLGIGLNQVGNSVSALNQQAPAGTLYNDWTQITLEPQGLLTQAADYENLTIAYRNNAPVRVSDVGRAVDSIQNETFWNAFWNAELGEIPTLVIGVTKLPGANTVKICDTIVNMLPALQETIPASISLSTIYNTATIIRASIWDVKFTLLLALGLVVIVIFLFLGKVSSTIIPSLALPLSVVGTFLVMELLGYSIDTLSMMALTLVVGFLVDDAIVVLENTVRHLEMGKTPLQAALDASAQISTTVLSMTLSLSAVFIPIVFMPGIMGQMFHEFAMVTVVAVLFSGFISLTLTPMLCARFLKAEKKQSRVEKQAHVIVTKLLDLYIPALIFCLRYRFLPILLAVVSCVIGAILFVTLPQDFLPAGDTGAIQGVTEGAQSISPERLTALQKEVTSILRSNPYVESVISLTNLPTLAPANQGLCFLMLKDPSKRPSIDEITADLMKKANEVVGMKTFLKPFPEINLQIGAGASAARADYTYAMSTITDPQQLYQAAEQLLERMKAMPELSNVSSDLLVSTPQLNLKILRDQAFSFGVTCQDIEKALTLAYAEARLSTFSTPLNTYWVVLELDDPYRLDVNSLDWLYVTPSYPQSDPAELVPLRSLVDWEMTTGPLSVNHVDQFNSVSLYFNIAPGASLSAGLAKIQAAADELIPSDVIRNFQGTAQVFQSTIPSMIALMGVGVMAIYILLGVLYESFIHPLTILSALPGALFGALITLLIFHQTLSLYSYVGLIVLIGIVMKNGIMLVEFANELVLHGKSGYDAIIEACRERFRPILMTTAAAGMGALPIAFGVGAGGGSRMSLGMVVVGGLIFAQFITYFFTPVVYLIFEQLQRRLSRD
ncbi:MAG: efflux RND transporter permease subunit, partial [Verrucomicrobia bacterium]|nr:efflux RND transporter permease subunit [Verrucomicrobiota bacterium]